MLNGESSAVLRHVRTLFSAGTAGGMSDGQLLERFCRRGGGPEAEAAFAVLVDRHGPMVLATCRRVLRDPNDAADAFQATFLVLVKKAQSVRAQDSLGPWLYGVSRRVAGKVRVAAARRAAREGRPSNWKQAGPDPGDEAERRELLAVIDEELARLPEAFRTAVVLCDVGGLTHDAAAQQLGCPVGTIESRLSRGRRRLREHLARRGLEPSMAFSAWLGPQSVPQSLSVATVAAATRTGSVSASVSRLAQGIVVATAWSSIVPPALVIGAVGLACGLGITAALPLPRRANSHEPRTPSAATPRMPTTVAALPGSPDARDWVGRRVITKLGTVLNDAPRAGEAPMRPAAEPGAERHVLRVYRVEEVRGPWLRLSPENKSAGGWVPVAQAVPYDRAIDYFTSMIGNPRESELVYRCRGTLWRWQKEYDKAIADLDESIRIDPRDDWAYGERGAAWRAKGEHDKAIADYDQAIQLDPRGAWPYTERGSVWEAKGEHDKAIADFNQAIELDPKHSPAYLYRGSLRGVRGEYAKASADFTEVIRLDPTEAGAYINRGNAWRAQDDHDRALADYDAAIRLDPREPFAYSGRALVWSDKGNLDRAIADNTEAIRLDPNHALAYLSRGNALRAQQQYDKAIADYDEAIRLNPSDGSAHYERGLAWHAKDDLERALADYDEALRLDPRLAGAYTGRGMVLLHEGESETAIADFDQAIRLDARNAEAYCHRGDACYSKGEFELAIADYAQAIQLVPADAEAHIGRARCWSAKGELDRAIADYDTAIRLGSDDARAYILRGDAWHARADYDKAIADYTEAIRIDGTAPAYENRGTAWCLKGDLDRAIADLTEAIRIGGSDSTYYHRGLAWCQQADFDKAIADLTEAIVLRPDHASPKYNYRGLARCAKGEYDKADADYGEAIRLDPRSFATYFNRAWLWATCPEARFRDGKRAVEAATMACDLSGWEDSGPLEALAAAHAEAGDFEAAVKGQESAVAICVDDAEREEARSRLALYHAKKPYREQAPRR